VREAALLLLALVPSLALRPALAWAEQREAPVQIAQTGSAADEPAAGSSTTAPPLRVLPGLEVIRVMGRPMEAIETEVPESVTQFDTAAIKALGAQDVSDLAKVSPNVEIRVAGATAPTFFIRGVGLSDFNANAAGAVSVYQDEVAINAPAIQIGQLYDVENIEVLRGPQGAGSGRNASAGAIKINSRKPTGQLAAEMRTNLGAYGSDHARNAFTQDYEGALEIPLVEEMLATRLAFRLSMRDPYAYNGCGGNPVSKPGGLPMIPLDPGPDGVFGPNPDPRFVMEPNPDPPPPFVSVLKPPPGPNDDIGRTDTGEPGVTGGEPARIYDRQGFCDDRDFLKVKNPDYYVLGGPTARERPQVFLLSKVPNGLPTAVNDAGAWAARGQLRFQPPGTEMDWLLNLHGSRLEQLSTLGQAMGTFGGRLGSCTDGGCSPNESGYIEPDNKEMQDAIGQAVREQYPDLPPIEQIELIEEILGNELARNLDIRPNRGDYNRVGRTWLDAWGGFLRGNLSIGSVNLTTISAYDTYERFRDQDYDFTPHVLFESIGTDTAWQFSQELRLGGELADTPLSWETGGYYLMEELSAEIQSFVTPENQSPLRVYDQNTWSFGIYASFKWDFLDDFTLEGGVRYNWERKNFDFSIFVPVKHAETGPLRTLESATWQAPTGTLSLTYRFAEDVSAYWKYSRGWKGGHFNASALSELNEDGEFRVPPVKPESIDAFETGLRGLFLDGRLGLGVALFYYEYTDYQVFVVEDNLGAPPTYNIINANDAEVYGAELDLRAEPLAGWAPPLLDGLVLTGRLGWLETQFLDFTNQVYRSKLVPGQGGLPTTLTLPVLVDYSGNQLINSPRLKSSFAAEWTIDLGRWGAVIPRYDFAWTDDIFFDPSEGRGSPDPFGDFPLPELTTGQRAFWLHNARLAYRTPAGNMEIAAWGRNLTDNVYKTFAFDASTFSNVVINYVGEPRTWGISLSVNW
jgi:outer membrane receptor protein involved in Fe transport